MLNVDNSLLMEPEKALEKTSDLEEEYDLEAIDEWKTKVKKKISECEIESTPDSLNDLMTYYLTSLGHMFARDVLKHACIFYSFHERFGHDDPYPYLDVMEAILTVYCNLELAEFNSRELPDKKCGAARRITYGLTVLLLNKQKHALHVLMRLKVGSALKDSSTRLLNTLYMYFLMKSPQEYSDEAFCLFYKLFQKWKHVRPMDLWEQMDKYMYATFDRKPNDLRDNAMVTQMLTPNNKKADNVVHATKPSTTDGTAVSHTVATANKLVALESQPFSKLLVSDEVNEDERVRKWKPLILFERNAVAEMRARHQEKVQRIKNSRTNKAEKRVVTTADTDKVLVQHCLEKAKRKNMKLKKLIAQKEERRKEKLMLICDSSNKSLIASSSSNSEDKVNSKSDHPDRELLLDTDKVLVQHCLEKAKRKKMKLKKLIAQKEERRKEKLMLICDSSNKSLIASSISNSEDKVNSKSDHPDRELLLDTDNVLLQHCLEKEKEKNMELKKLIAQKEERIKEKLMLICDSSNKSLIANSSSNLQSKVDSNSDGIDGGSQLPSFVPDPFVFDKTLSFLDEELPDFDWNANLPIKKRKLKAAEEEISYAAEEEISYPATPMTSIAELEGLHNIKAFDAKHSISNSHCRPKPPLPFHPNPIITHNNSLFCIANKHRNTLAEPEEIRPPPFHPNPIITDRFNINNPTLNYNVNNVPRPPPPFHPNPIITDNNSLNDIANKHRNTLADPEEIRLPFHPNPIITDRFNINNHTSTDAPTIDLRTLINEHQNRMNHYRNLVAECKKIRNSMKTFLRESDNNESFQDQ